jgi:isoleucyl-tRNA synthetase
MGHFLNKVIKDAINRFKMLQGFRVPFVPGWDCHGLPIELVALEQLKNKGETPSAALIRRLARSWAEKHVESQMRDFKRWGIYGDWEQAYCTMDKEYEALQLELFGKLYDKGMVFRALKPVYWSPSSKTALAESELEYKDNHESKSIHVIFPLTFESQKNLCASVKGKLGALIWTTTPWTLPSNMAICYGLKLNYCIVHVPRSPWSVDHLIMAEERLSDLQDVEYSVLSRVDSSKLSGLEAQHPFEPRNAVFLESEFVTADLGTGLVHASPAHGQEDFMVCKRHFGDILSLVDHAGYFNEKSSERFRGKHIFTDGTSEVIEACKENKVLLNLQTYRHRYPYDWRTKLPVIQRATEQWFVDLRECKDEAIAALNDVEIYPASGKL